MVSALCVATVVACGQAVAQPIYNIIDIGSVPGEVSIPNGISSGGVATGYAIPPVPPRTA
jgi:hypothetical protein